MYVFNMFDKIGRYLCGCDTNIYSYVYYYQHNFLVTISKYIESKCSNDTLSGYDRFIRIIFCSYDYFILFDINFV